ncbi:MAG: hypothetical protein ACD_8C00068G0009 [uncultured bacterium]|nr:MAG: hypothetical protein ACD_8C00068G0009 [uncultured bacterium]
MKSNRVTTIGIILGVAMLLLGFFVWNFFKQETVALKVDEIEDIKGLGYSGQRKVVLNNKGDIFIAYRKKYQGKSEIFVAKVFREKKDWKISGTAKPISTVGKGADQRVPSIAVDEKNNLHVVWYGAESESKEETNNRQIKYSQSIDDGKSWSEWKNIALVGGYEGEDYWQEHPYILTKSENELFVAWEGKDENNKKQQIKFSKSFDGGKSWSQWRNVRETLENTQSRPTMVREKPGRSGNGKLHLLAYSSFGNDDNKQQLVHAWSDDNGNSWSQWEMISDSSLDSRHLSAVIDRDEKIHVVWRSLNSKGKSQIMHRFLKEGQLSEAKIVADSEKYQFFPNVSADARGNVFVTWMESETSSKLPNEDPTDGKIFLSKYDGEKFSKPVQISQSETNLYPNLPERVKNGIPPLLYESQSTSSDSFVLMLNVRK